MGVCVWSLGTKMELALIRKLLPSRFSSVEPLGSGGAAVVFKAFDSDLGKEVALKAPLAVGESAEQRLRTEYSLLSLCSSQLIVKPYELLEIQDTVILSMELLSGNTLANIIDGRLPEYSLIDRIEILHQVALGLSELHRHGIIFRDLTPSNIMVNHGVKHSGANSAACTVKLFDLGIARLKDQRGMLEEDHQAEGTAEYMSPEQHQGRPTDERSDVYAFGVVAFQLLTGSLPFATNKAINAIQDESARFLKLHAQHAVGKIPSLRGFNKAVPRSLDTLVRVCLEKHPDDRWESSIDIAKRLEKLSVTSRQHSTGNKTFFSSIFARFS